MQDLRQIKQRQPGHRQTQYRTGNQAVHHRSTHARHVFGSETLRRNHRQTAGKTESYHQQHHKNRRRHADCRQCLYTEQTSDNQNIRNIIQLLKNISD